MIEYVEDRRHERQRGRHAQAARLERKRQAETDKDDSDVFDRVVGEQSLQIVFHQCVENTEQRGDAGRDQHRNAPPPQRRTGQVEDEPHESVHRNLRHDPAHQCRDVARRRRVRERQPRVQRNETGFGPGTDQCEDQNDRAHAGGCDPSDLIERITALGTGEQAEREQQA